MRSMSKKLFPKLGKEAIGPTKPTKPKPEVCGVPVKLKTGTKTAVIAEDKRSPADIIG